MSGLEKWKAGGFKTPLSRARGVGAAGGESVKHWISHRIAGLAMLLMTIWFAVQIVQVLPYGMYGFTFWAQKPVSAIGLAGLLCAGLTHARLTIQVVIEDYVSDEGAKWREIISLHLLYWLALITGLFSLVKLVLEGTL